MEHEHKSEQLNLFDADSEEKPPKTEPATTAATEEKKSYADLYEPEKPATAQGHREHEKKYHSY